MSIRQGSTIIAGSSGSGGTSNYNNLENKPSINGITLEGNKTTEDLNINSLPDQTGNEGKVLITNGTEASWQTLPETGLPLFAHIWSDHLLTNSSYLRADTFSWQDGNIYYTAYNELVNEKNLTTETSTDTINNITITYYRTPKGYKIVLPDMADTIAQLYENTGTAWYYILDTDNTRFKLPRNSRYESGTTSEKAGDFSAESLPNITGSLSPVMGRLETTPAGSGFVYANNAGVETLSAGAFNLNIGSVNFNASRNSSTYQEGAKVNPDHVTQFLYFYVGNTVQNETTINVAAITEALNKKADRDLNNLTEDATNAVKPSDITNCITKIPQDIKLELNNGVLTLKAGSKVYVPNGFETDGTTRKFDTKTIESDINFNALNYATGQHTIGLLSSNLIQALFTETQQFSGDTAPTITTTYAFWYDTANNIVKYTTNNGSTWTGGCSLPFGLISIENNTGITSIDQVFNGFGYIGSTIFALPGVEGLIPNGRNADGSLNNTKFTTTSVSILTTSSTNNYILVIHDDGNIDNWSIARYDEDKNIVYRIDNNQQVMLCFCGEFARESGRITSFNPKTVFRAVDRNDTEWASTASKPSNRYIDLTIQASGTQYTAPANGWFVFDKQAAAQGQYIQFNESNKCTLTAYSYDNNSRLSLLYPILKSKKISVVYNASGVTNGFKFIYDEGAK